MPRYACLARARGFPEAGALEGASVGAAWDWWGSGALLQAVTMASTSQPASTNQIVRPARRNALDPPQRISVMA